MSIHVWRPCPDSSVFTAFLPRMFDVYGTRHAATSVHALGEDAPNTGIYSIFPSLYNTLWNKTCDHKCSCLWRRCHNTGICSIFRLSVHILPLCTTQAQESCAKCLRPKTAFKKQALFWVRLSRLENIAVRSVFARENTDPMAAVVILRIDKHVQRMRRTKTLEFCTFSDVQR